MTPGSAILVRVGIDASYGHWNAPADPATGEFVYVPIPESCPMRPESQVTYAHVLPALEDFCYARGLDLRLDLGFPGALADQLAHLDPDFEHLTYGDDGGRRASDIARLERGDVLAFYAGLRSVTERTLIYALVGILTVDEVVLVGDVPCDRAHENAHTRRLSPSHGEIVVRGLPSVSGRLSRYVPIGEWRDLSYRVRHDLLDEWGGLSVKNGFIQRSARPPRFLQPERFRQWLDCAAVPLIAQNN